MHLGGKRGDGSMMMGARSEEMKKALYPSGGHVLQIAKFYASVAIAASGAMILIAAIIADPLLVPAVLVGFVCAHYQK